VTALERFDLSADQVPNRWYNVIPDLPRAMDKLLDPDTMEPASDEYLRRLLPSALVAQDSSTERWITIPDEVRAAYQVWRPTPLMRAHGLERLLDTPARIYFKYEGGSPSGSHKLNSALAQAFFAKNQGIKRLITDTGAGQWGSALALAGALAGIEVRVFMARSSYHQKPYRRYLMETYGASVEPSPGPNTRYGRELLAHEPDHPGSEGTAVSEALEVVRSDPESRFSMGAFANHVLLHQTVIGIEAREQLDEIGVDPDFIVASVGCGSNMGGIALPWVADKLSGALDVQIIAAEPAACATLTKGEYRYDYPDTGASGPLVRTYTLGHEFQPPPIHAGGLRYHGAAPLVGLLRHEGVIDAVAYPQSAVFDAGRTAARTTGLLPAPESAHAIRAVIDLARRCKENGRRANILFCWSGLGTLDLAGYSKHNAGELSEAEEFTAAMVGSPV
jgi:tryptophan synthase beta chain